MPRARTCSLRARTCSPRECPERSLVRPANAPRAHLFASSAHLFAPRTPRALTCSARESPERVLVRFEHALVFRERPESSLVEDHVLWPGSNLAPLEREGQLPDGKRSRCPRGWPRAPPVRLHKPCSTRKGFFADVLWLGAPPRERRRPPWTTVRFASARSRENVSLHLSSVSLGLARGTPRACLVGHTLTCLLRLSPPRR